MNMKLHHGFSSLSMIAVVVFLSVISVSSQTKPRVVQWDAARVSVKMTSVHSEAMDQIDGLEITDVTAGGKSITLGQPFDGDDEWLKTLGVKIKNVSSVEISIVQLSLFLPQLMPGGPLVALCHGCGGVGMGETISPGEEVEMKLVLYDWLVGQINAKSSLSAIDKAEIWNISVTLADGKKWTSGCMKTTDAKNACPKPKL